MVITHISSLSSILGKSPTSILLGLSKYPLPTSQKKQCIPPRIPLPSPTCGSSSSMPTNHPKPSSATLPINLISPLAPFSNWHRIPTDSVLATEWRYSGSQISGCPLKECLTCGFSRRNWCFHFLKLSGRALQVSSLITYFSICALFSISLRMELGFRSITEMIMPFWTPQKSKERRSSSIGVMASPFLFLRTSLMQGASEPQRFSMFSLSARMVDSGSRRSSGMRREERLCSRSTLIMGSFFLIFISGVAFLGNLNCRCLDYRQKLFFTL